MTETSSQRFVRVPTEYLEALIQTQLSGGQCRVLLWVIRQTHGWHRLRTPFSWYRIAREIRMGRSAVFRAGQALINAGILVEQEKQLSLQPDVSLWKGGFLCSQSVAGKQRRTSGGNVVDRQRLPLPGRNATGADTQQKRDLQATFFRRAKDIKDSLKKYIKTGLRDDLGRPSGTAVSTERHHLAESARPVPRIPLAAIPVPKKYERLSQD